MFKKKDETSTQSTTGSVKHSRFKDVNNKRNSILDTGHPAAWVNRTTEREDTDLDGQDWRSEVYMFSCCRLSILFGISVDMFFLFRCSFQIV